MSFKTSVDTMNTAANHVATTNADIQGDLNRLRGIVDEVRGSWKGQAQSAFDGLMQRWDENAKKLNDALLEISNNIKSNARSFDTTDTDNAAAFSA